MACTSTYACSFQIHANMFINVENHYKQEMDLYDYPHSTKNKKNTNTRVCVFLQCMYIGVYSTHVSTFGRLGEFVVFFHVCNFDDRFFMILNANIYILSIRINCIFIRSLIQYTLTGVHALCNRTYRYTHMACYSHLRTEPHSRSWALLNIDYYW